jgi:hypothetical protein
LCGGDAGVDGPPLLLFWAASVLLAAAGETNSGGICIRFCGVPHWLGVLCFFFLFVCLGGFCTFFFGKGKHDDLLLVILGCLV